MSLINVSNIVAGSFEVAKPGPHYFQCVYRYHLAVDGRTEEIVRKSAVLSCCKNLDSEYDNMSSHINANCYGLTMVHKKRIVMYENAERSGRGTSQYPIVSRTTVPNVVNHVQELFNSQKEQIFNLKSELANRTEQLACEQLNNEYLNNQLVIKSTNHSTSNLDNLTADQTKFTK